MIRYSTRLLVAAVAVFLTGGGAYADDTGFQSGPTKSGPPAYADGTDFQIGSARIGPSLGLSLYRTSNLFLEASDTTSDWVTTVSPGLKLALPVHPFLLELQGQIDWVTYADNSSEDAVNWSVGGSIGADFAQGLSFAIKTTYSDRYYVRTHEFGTGEDSATGNTTAKVSYTLRDDFRFVLTWFRNSYEYDRSIAREHVENYYQLGFFWRYQPRLSVVLEGGLTDYSYDSNTALDGDARWLNLGLSWDVGTRSTGYVKGGYRWKYYDVINQALNTVDGNYYTVAIGLNHRFSSRTALELAVSRMSMESDFPLNPYYLRNEIRGGLEQRFGRRFNDFSGRIFARYGRDEYLEDTTYAGDSGRRTDSTLGWGVGIWFDGVRWLRLGVSLSKESRNSTFDTFDNKVTLLGVEISARF